MLKALCTLNGISGREASVREYIISQIKDYCTYETDKMGNLICFKKGKKAPSQKVMVAAHMDEVGMLVNYIGEDGSLSVTSVGGVDPRVAAGRQVTVGEKNIPGVLGSRAIHNLSTEERKKAPTFESLKVDIGAMSREEAEEVVNLGDSVYFLPTFESLGDGLVMGKALDDRAGCAIMIVLIQSELLYDTTFVFTVQEEIGTRGAKTAAFAVEPDVAFVLETTTAADIPSASGAERVCEVGKGAVVSYMDRGTIYDKKLYDLAFSIGAEFNIPVQTKTMVAGGNDAGAIHVSKGGVRTLAISAPCRYLHSPCCVLSEKDIESCASLLSALLTAVHAD